ncbi:MAG: sigma-70 family RNA polymerase sigma factor [Gemmatimonadota bacterium]
MQAGNDVFPASTIAVRLHREPDHPAASFEREALPHLDAVQRFARRLCHSTSDADDLVQETYLRAFRAWETFTPGTRARSWLFTICRNAFLRDRQRERRRREVMLRAAGGLDETHERQAPEARPLLTGAPPRDPEERLMAVAVRHRVLQEIERIPDHFREAVLLCDVQELPYADATERLSVPLGTLKSRLFRGRRILRGALADYARERGYPVATSADAGPAH